MASPSGSTGSCANSDWVSSSRDDGSADISVEARSAPSALRAPLLASLLNREFYSVTCRHPHRRDARKDNEDRDSSAPAMAGRGRASAEFGYSCRNRRQTMERAPCAARWRMSCRLPRYTDRRTAVSRANETASQTGPTGLLSVPPPGPAMPVTAMLDVHAQAFQRSFRHGAHHRLAHGPLGLDQPGRHAEERHLERVVIADHAAGEHLRAARNLGQPLTDEAPSARLGDADVQTFCSAPREHQRGQIVIPLPIYELSPRARLSISAPS